MTEGPAGTGAAPVGGLRAGRGVLTVACVSTFVVNANTSAVSILLPSIAADLDTSIELLQWAVTGYLLVGAAVIVTSGALGDILGRRRVFLAGLALFIASCALIALAGSGAMVVVGRVIQGAAGATILACGLSLLSVASSGAQQMRAVALWGAAAAAGAAAGPLVGGLLDEATGWQGLFWIDALIALACVPLTLRTVQESSDPNRPRTIDLAGTALIAGILVPFVFAMTKGGDWGWVSVPTLSCLVVSVAATVGFVVVEGRVTAPLVDLRLLRNLALVGSTLAILIGAGAIAALGLLMSLYFQDPAGLGMSSLAAGLASLPVAALVILVAPAITPLTGRFGTRPIISAGFLLLTGGFAALVFVQPELDLRHLRPSAPRDRRRAGTVQRPRLRDLDVVRLPRRRRGRVRDLEHGPLRRRRGDDRRGRRDLRQRRAGPPGRRRVAGGRARERLRGRLAGPGDLLGHGDRPRRPRTPPRPARPGRRGVRGGGRGDHPHRAGAGGRGPGPGRRPAARRRAPLTERAGAHDTGVATRSDDERCAGIGAAPRHAP